ncbi:MAG: hypothetical protein K0V04_05005 [Deltaproteobacteria bacterium]|nr:hypothetical protein [Deltaproteobacteria bacterium]
MTTFFVAGLLAGGCEGVPQTPEPAPTTSTATGTASSSTGGSTSTAAPTGDATDPTMAATGTIFDVASPDVPIDIGCHKADFLFVIDNSGSMQEHQQQLLESFPGFIDAILGSLEELDSIHVGVVTSDAYAFNEPGCQGLGALVTQTGGTDSSQAVCTPFVEGRRFFTEQDSLAAAFNCVARVGTEGSGNELPMSATVAALQPEMTGVGGCNEGFLRDDAILVVVVVSDDPPFPGTPDDAWPLIDTTVWREAILETKGGSDDAIVVIGVVSYADTSCVCPWCCPGYGCMAPNDNAIELVESFDDHGALGSVCTDDYAAVLSQTIETIEATCVAFEPPG